MRPRRVETFGPQVADIAAAANYAPDPQQELALDLIFAIQPDGRPVSFEVCIICARQNLKTGTFIMAVLGWLFVLEVGEVMWSAHELATSADAMKIMGNLLQESPTLSKHLLSQKNHGIYDENGSERIELNTRQVVKFRTRTRDGMRGLGQVERLIVDEALKLTPRMTGAMYPTLAAKDQPQIILGSTAGPIEAAALREIRDRGRAGISPRMTYLEWLAKWAPCRDADGQIDLECRHPKDAPRQGLDCALDREELIRQANPTLTTDRMTMETQRALRQALPPAEYMRECMGKWEDPPSGGATIFGPGRWGACATDMVPETPAAIGLACDRDQLWGSIAASTVVEHIDDEDDSEAEPEDRTFIAAVDRREGTDWMIAEAKRIQDETDCMVLVDESGPAAFLIPLLEEEDVAVEPVKLHETSEACGRLFKKVRDRTLLHPSSTELDAAVEGADWRWIGDRRVLGRKSSSVDISMLEAAVLAARGAELSGAFTL